MAKKPRKLSLVRFAREALPASTRRDFPFRADGVYIFLGEIPNMRGHCVVAEKKSGRVFAGYHTENFVEITEENT